VALFGANHVLTGSTQNVLRIYNQPDEDVPAAFPGRNQTIPPGLVGCVSFRPNVAAVIAGDLDEQLTAYFRAAPAGSLVTAWHEGNGSHGITAADFRAMHVHLANLALAVAPHIFYGAIIDAYPVNHEGQQLSEWVPPAVQFVGIDGYQGPKSSTTADDVFAECEAQLAAIPGMGPRLVTETNTADGDQAAWLTDVAAFAFAHNYVGYLVFTGGPAGSEQMPPVPAALVDLLGIMAATAAIHD
jgi:hypothetical protein